MARLRAARREARAQEPPRLTPGEQGVICSAWLVLPDTENADIGGVHDADGEPGNSGGVVGEVPGYVGTVPD